AGLAGGRAGRAAGRPGRPGRLGNAFGPDPARAAEYECATHFEVRNKRPGRGTHYRRDSAAPDPPNGRHPPG
ncbi:hypothetical protein AB0C29_39135, partial [Actinoplanes sp. NPDC048791]|uniref:hypothetical protein n=1 Tax=Actinoplanes sp. NPDC048791 TaxID=3154623 RepID=UPI0033DD3291